MQYFEILGEWVEKMPPMPHPGCAPVGRLKRRGDGRRSQVFQIGIWHQSKRKIAGEHRTNIHAEEAHIKVYAELVINHSCYLEVN